jgi:hypothetical protein
VEPIFTVPRRGAAFAARLPVCRTGLERHGRVDVWSFERGMIEQGLEHCEFLYYTAIAFEGCQDPFSKSRASGSDGWLSLATEPNQKSSLVSSLNRLAGGYPTTVPSWNIGVTE